MRKLVTAKLIDETEGAFRYREINSSGIPIHGDNEGALIGDIYLRKMAVTGKPPQQIRVTIEY